MDNKKSPKGRKRSAKGGTSIAASIADENFWDCSVCTFRNNAEAFKCSMCDVRKGTSTRKPRLNPDLVAQQQAQALTPPPAAVLAGSSGVGAGPSSSGVKSPASVEDEDIADEEEEDESDLAALASLKANKRLSKEKPPKEKKKESKKPINKAKLRNVDRNSATYHSVTVNDFTVVITEFKPKIKKEKEKKESKSHGSGNPTSTNSSSSSPTSSAANTPAPAEKQLNGSISSSFDAALHGSTTINSAKTLGLSVDSSKNRIPSPNDQGMELSDEIKDRQPVLAAALQSPLKYSGSSTKLNNLGSNSLSTTDPESKSHVSPSRPPAVSSTHYPHGGVHHPRPHPHQHQVSPNPNKIPGNDRHPIAGFPSARPSQAPPSSLPSSNKAAPNTHNPTNSIKGNTASPPSGPTSRASSTGSSSTTSSQSLPASALTSSTHRHSSSIGNSANGSMTTPKNSNLSQNN